MDGHENFMRQLTSEVRSLSDRNARLTLNQDVDGLVALSEQVARIRQRSGALPAPYNVRLSSYLDGVADLIAASLAQLR